MDPLALAVQTFAGQGEAMTALCSFNPMYGQGMSVAAVEAMKLRDELARGVDTLDPIRFFRAVKPVVDIPWQIASGGDLTFPGVEGPRNFMVRFINRYLARLHAAAEHDEVLSGAFIRVANLLARPLVDAPERSAAGAARPTTGRSRSGGQREYVALFSSFDRRNSASSYGPSSAPWSPPRRPRAASFARLVSSSRRSPRPDKM